MGRAVLILPRGAQQAAEWIKRAPAGTRLTFQGPKRTVPQNDRMWPMLTAISAQLVWHGKLHPTDHWKDYFMHMLRRDTWMPDEEGGYVPVGRSTSNLSKGEHSDLMTIIEAFAARHDVDLWRHEE